jgi:SAM-dependent methyltransferase
MLSELWEDNFPLVCTATAAGSGPGAPTKCGARLERRGVAALACSNPDCGTEYSIRDGLPVLLSPNHPAPPADYDDPFAVQMYAEMHLSSFRTDLTAGMTADAADGVPGHADAFPRSVGSITDSIDATTIISRAANMLHHMEDLTGPYYRHMATIILENLLHPAGLVADIGCGMARMAFEFELGAWPGCYLGLDLSYRLLIEAQHAFTGETRHIRLIDTGTGGLHTRLVPIQPPKLPPDRYTLAIGDSAHIPLPDQSCAAVVALNLVDRVADPIAVTRELWRCVAPDGLLVLSDPFQWRDRPPEQRIYSFDPLTRDLENAVKVDLPLDRPHAPFVLRDRASREISIHDNATALYRRKR